MTARYTVSREGPMEVHRVEIHQVDLVAAAGLLNKALYSQYRLSERLSERTLALALILRAIEEHDESAPKPENVTAFPTD